MIDGMDQSIGLFFTYFNEIISINQVVSAFNNTNKVYIFFFFLSETLRHKKISAQKNEAHKDPLNDDNP